MTIIELLVKAVLHDPKQPNYGYNNPSMAGTNNTPSYYASGSCDMCAGSVHGCRHCRRMARHNARCVRRDMREMRRASRWDTLLSPPPTQQQNQYGPMQYSRQQEQAYVPQQYGSAQKQQTGDASRTMSQQAPAPAPRRNSVYDVPAPEGPPPPYTLNESSGRQGSKQFL